MTKPTVTPITAADPMARSADIVGGNIERLKELFPEAVVEGKIDFEVLKQLLGGVVDERPEKYGLNWHGKRQARQLALTPSTGTLRPCPEESVEWDTTQNLMIEGDNLEVLKILQKSYAGKVKLIYIDPPYNTGKDFVYPDNFRDSIQNYLEITGQVEGGAKVSSNAETSGRYHTDWLNMMLPRIKVARDLLRPDGLLFISINDVEQANLRGACNEIFGEENFIAQLVWMKGKEGGNDNAGFGLHHDYILCYGRAKLAAAATIALDDKDTSRHITQLSEENLVAPGISTYKDGEPFQLINLSKQKDYVVSIPLKDGTTLEWDSYCPQRTIDQYLQIGKLFVGSRRVPYVKSFLSDEAAGSKPSTLLGSEHGTTKAGGIAIRELFGDGKIFSYPKPPALLQRLIRIAADGENASDPPIVVDFFGGSGTTGEALFRQTASDGVPRRFILVQVPLPLDPDEADQSAAYELTKKLGLPPNLSALTKERLRRAAKRVGSEDPMFAGDLGFRVYKLDSSCIAEWDASSGDLESTLLSAVENIKPDRTEHDVLVELLLKRGLDLCVPSEQRIMSGKTVHAIGGGALIACLDTSLSRIEAEAVARGTVDWLEELRPTGEVQCVFRDSAFSDDVAKTNLAAILAQAGVTNVRSL